MPGPVTNPLTLSVNAEIDKIDLPNSTIRRLEQVAGAQSEKIRNALFENVDAEIRVKRIQAESDLQRLIAIRKKSDELIEADEAMKRHPGMWTSATHYRESRDKAKRQNEAYQKAQLFSVSDYHRRFVESHAEDFGGRDRAEEIYEHESMNKRASMVRSFLTSGNIFKGGRRFREKLIESLMNEGLTRQHAERYVADTRQIKATTEWRRHGARLNREAYWGRHAFNEDMAYMDMDERERFVHDNAKRYGGGDEGKSRAESVWQKKVFKEFRWLRPLAQNSTLINKNLPTIAKGLKGATGLPVVGKFIRNPYTAGIGLAISTLILGIKNVTRAAKIGAVSGRSGLLPWQYESAERYLDKFGGTGADLAKPVHSWRSAQGKMFHGGGTEHLETLARYGIFAHPGMTHDQMMAQVGQKIKYLVDNGRENEAIALADEIGIDAPVFETMKRHGGSAYGHIINEFSATAKETTKTRNIKAGEVLSDAWNLIWSGTKNAATDIGWNFIDPLRIRYLFDAYESAKPFFGTEDAANSADAYDANGGATANASAGKTVSFVINGDVKVDADNPQQFVAALSNESQREASLSALDPMLVA